MVAFEHPELKKWRKVEREFFISLNHLCRFYKLEIPAASNLDFPLNISTAFSRVNEQLTANHPDLGLTILQDETCLATVATVKIFNTNTTLYYIPCEPLHTFLECKDRKMLAGLCLSVFSYLYRVVAVPFHTDGTTYMSSMYSMVEDWIVEDEEREEQEADLDELAENHCSANNLLRLIYQGEHLEGFQQRLTEFVPCTKQEADFLITATKAWELFRDYPNASVMETIHPELTQTDGDAESRVRADQYISFIWSFNDSIYDTLEDSINCELQEYSVIDEPKVFQRYNKIPKTEVHDFDFHTRLFEMMNLLVADLRELILNHKTNPTND